MTNSLNPPTCLFFRKLEAQITPQTWDLGPYNICLARRAGAGEGTAPLLCSSFHCLPWGICVPEPQNERICTQRDASKPQASRHVSSTATVSAWAIKTGTKRGVPGIYQSSVALEIWIYLKEIPTEKKPLKVKWSYLQKPEGRFVPNVKCSWIALSNTLHYKGRIIPFLNKIIQQIIIIQKWRKLLHWMIEMIQSKSYLSVL